MNLLGWEGDVESVDVRFGGIIESDCHLADIFSQQVNVTCTLPDEFSCQVSKLAPGSVLAEVRCGVIGVAETCLVSGCHVRFLLHLVLAVGKGTRVTVPAKPAQPVFADFCLLLLFE